MTASLFGPPRVFISFNTSTMRDQAKQLQRALDRAGARVATPGLTLPPGHSVVGAIADAISSSQLFVCLISPGDENSSWIKFETGRMLEECWSDPDSRIAAIAPAVGAIPKALRHRPFVLYYSHEYAGVDDWGDPHRADNFVRTLLRTYGSDGYASEPMTDEEIRSWRNRLVHIQSSEALRSHGEDEQLIQQLWQELGPNGPFIVRGPMNNEARDRLIERILDRALIAKALGDGTLTTSYYERLEQVLSAEPEQVEPDDESAYKLGLLAFESNDFEKAAGHFRRARARFANLYGKVHPASIAASFNLALTLSHLGEDELAERTYLDVISTSQEALGEAHPQSINAFTNLGLLYAKTGRPSEAVPLLQRALEGLHKVRPADSTEIASIESELERLR